ncbi:MAG: hypothetical protein Q9218_000987 [Villophora microphyllina]
MQLYQKHGLKDDLQRVQKFTTAFLSNMNRVVSLDVDYSGDKRTEIYLRNNLYQKTLSMQLSLGYWGEQQRQSLSSKVASAILQLRWAALTFAFGLRSSPQSSTSAREAETNRAGMHNAVESPASRLLFKYLFRFMRSLGEEALQHGFRDPSWRELNTLLSKSSAALHHFEKIFVDVENSIRHIYETKPDERKEIEREMLISGHVPFSLWPAVSTLLATTLDVVMKDFNLADLYFHDVSWLGLSDDPASIRWRKEHRLDVIRKVERTQLRREERRDG